MVNTTPLLRRHGEALSQKSAGDAFTKRVKTMFCVVFWHQEIVILRSVFEYVIVDKVLAILD